MHFDFNISQYCPPEVTLRPHFWVEKDFSPCFTETILSSFVVPWALVFGSVQILSYRRMLREEGHEGRRVYPPVSPKLYRAQIILNLCHPFLSLLTLSLEFFVFKPSKVYLYMGLPIIQDVVAWPIIFYLFITECKYKRRVLSSRGTHGLVLLSLWTGLFVLHNLICLNLWNLQSWYLTVEKKADIFYILIFVGKYLVTAGTFFLGWRGPGIRTVREWRRNQQEDQEYRQALVISGDI